MKAMDVIVTGGRSYRNYDKVKWAFSLLQGEVKTIIHGGASGADELAEIYAKENGIPTKVYAAEWKTRGKRAGPLRNSKMLDENPDAIVIVFPGGRGTADCKRKAIARNHILLVVHEEEKE